MCDELAHNIRKLGAELLRISEALGRQPKGSTPGIGPVIAGAIGNRNNLMPGTLDDAARVLGAILSQAQSNIRRRYEPATEGN